MTQETNVDDALLWAREFVQRKQAGKIVADMAARGDIDHELRGIAEAFRAMDAELRRRWPGVIIQGAPWKTACIQRQMVVASK